MQVTVKLHGTLGRSPGAPGPFDFSLPEGSTAGELMRELAERVGKPFSEALASSDPRLPRTLRMFVDGVMIVTRDQPLVARDVFRAGVTVVLMTPVAGGA